MVEPNPWIHLFRLSTPCPLSQTMLDQHVSSYNDRHRCLATTLYDMTLKHLFITNDGFQTLVCHILLCKKGCLTYKQGSQHIVVSKRLLQEAWGRILVSIFLHKQSRRRIIFICQLVSLFSRHESLFGGSSQTVEICTTTPRCHRRIFSQVIVSLPMLGIKINIKISSKMVMASVVVTWIHIMCQWVFTSKLFHGCHFSLAITIPQSSFSISVS